MSARGETSRGFWASDEARAIPKTLCLPVLGSFGGDASAYTMSKRHTYTVTCKSAAVRVLHISADRLASILRDELHIAGISSQSKTGDTGSSRKRARPPSVMPAQKLPPLASALYREYALDMALLDLREVCPHCAKVSYCIHLHR